MMPFCLVACFTLTSRVLILHTKFGFAFSSFVSLSVFQVKLVRERLEISGTEVSTDQILRLVNYCKIAITSTQPTFILEPEEELNKLLLMKVSDRDRNVKVIMLVVLK